MSTLAPVTRSAPVFPLMARGALLLTCALLAALTFGPAAILGPTLLLLAIAAMASLPFSYAPRLAQPLAEVVLTAVLIGALGERGTPFLPYLVVPALVVGTTLGIRPALTVALGGDVALLATGLAVGTASTDRSGTLMPHLQWAFLALAVGGLAGWARRLRLGDIAAPEAAYVEAHRLLSELHVVARQLSLGLDTTTLAAALCDELERVTGSPDNLVLVRGDGGLYHRLTGSGGLPVSATDLEEAWLSADPAVVSSAQGSAHLVLPVRMGERVVALAVSTFDATAALDRHIVGLATKVVHLSGSRLASAMLFDEVRQLATQDERLRLARDIHDGIAQDVASMGFFVDDAMHGADEATTAKLRLLRAELRRIVGELRLSIFDLRLAADDSTTLGTVIGEHARRAAAQAGLTVHVVIDESASRLTSVAEHELMRIAQEAMTNVRRHAQATNVWVECTVDAPAFALRIADDGRGLGPSTDASMGLKGIRERVARLGAEVRIGDRAAGGTLVEVTKPGTPDRRETMRSQARHG